MQAPTSPSTHPPIHAPQYRMSPHTHLSSRVSCALSLAQSMLNWLSRVFSRRNRLAMDSRNDPATVQLLINPFIDMCRRFLGTFYYPNTKI